MAVVGAELLRRRVVAAVVRPIMAQAQKMSFLVKDHADARTAVVEVSEVKPAVVGVDVDDKGGTRTLIVQQT